MRLTPLFPAALTLVLLACTRPDINQPVDTFVCVARPGDLSSTRAPEARGDLFGSPAAIRRLSRHDGEGCLGIALRLPGPWVDRSLPTRAALDIRDAVGLGIRVPRQHFTLEPPPVGMEKMDSIRIRIKRLPPHMRFRDEADAPANASFPSVVGFELAYNPMMMAVPPTPIGRIEDGFEVLESAGELETPNRGYRVYLPTDRHPDIYLFCPTITRDSMGVIRPDPVCRVITTLDASLQVEYTVLGQDRPEVRDIDAEIKRLVRGMIRTAPQAASAPAQGT